MLTWKRSKLRRRDIASHRYFQQTCGVGRTQSLRGGAGTPSVSREHAEQSRLATRSTARVVEPKMILRLDGDSIAYFWALEVETAISHKALRANWQELANALVATPWG